MIFPFIGRGSQHTGRRDGSRVLPSHQRVRLYLFPNLKFHPPPPTSSTSSASHRGILAEVMQGKDPKFTGHANTWSDLIAYGTPVLTVSLW